MTFIYAVRNQKGQYLTGKWRTHYHDSWVDTLEEARIYRQIGTAKGQSTLWAKQFPEHGNPSVVEFEVVERRVIDRPDLQDEIRTRAEAQRLEKYSGDVERAQERLKRAQVELARLEA